MVICEISHFLRGHSPSHVPTDQIGPMRLLGYDLNLVELKLNGGLTAKHRNDDVDRIVVDLDALDGTGEGTEGAIQNTDGITDGVVDDDFLLLYAHGVDLFLGKGSGVVAGSTDEAGHSADVPDNMPGIIAVDHLYQHVAGIDLAVISLADTGLSDLGDGLQPSFLYCSAAKVRSSVLTASAASCDTVLPFSANFTVF